MSHISVRPEASDENEIALLHALDALAISGANEFIQKTSTTTLANGTPSGGGGGFTELQATGTVNGSNLTFTFTQVPTYIVSDGVWFKPRGNDALLTVFWTNVGTTITMVNPPSYSIFGVA